MPKLDKQGPAKGRTKKKGRSSITAKPKREKVATAEKDYVEELSTEHEHMAATPFADGLVNVRFSSATIIPHSGDAEVELLSRFLTCFSETVPFVGNISSKASFMKRKGGRLL